MKENLESHISMNLRPCDITTVKEISVDERRKVADVLRNMLEDIISGDIKLELEPDLEGGRKSTVVRVDPTFREKFDAYKKSIGVKSTDKIVEQALKVIREQRANRPQKSNEERIARFLVPEPPPDALAASPGRGTGSDGVMV